MRLGTVEIKRRAVSVADALTLRTAFAESEHPQKAWVAVASLVLSTQAPGWPERQAGMSWSEYGRLCLPVLVALTGQSEADLLVVAHQAVEALPIHQVQEARVREIRDFFGLPPMSSLGCASPTDTSEESR